MNYHHIGVACSDIDATAEQYRQMGYVKGEVVVDPLQNIRICFLTHDSMPTVELLAPVNENSPVVDILKKNGTTPYHTCYSVPDLDSAVKELRRQRFIVVSKPKPACALGASRVAFLYHNDMGLIELVGE